MADAKTFNCPTCGAQLTVLEGQAELKCSFCGNTVIVPEELRTPTTVNPQVIVEMVQNQQQAVSSGFRWLPWLIFGIIACVTLSIIVSTVLPLIFAAQLTSQFANPDKFFPTDVGPAMNTAVALATSARQRTPEPTHTPAPSPTAAPSRTPTTVRSPTMTRTPLPVMTPFAKVAFRDDLTSAGNDWDTVNSDNLVLDFVNDGYRIYIGQAGSGHTTWIKNGFTDVNVEVDVKRLGGPDDGWFGVLCRAKQDVGSYGFAVSGQGQYEIQKYDFTQSEGSVRTLASGTLNPNPVSPTDFNHLRADCVGNLLSLYLGNRVLARATDSQFTSGGFGMVALTGDSDQPGVDMLFSHFVVHTP